jgi:glucoamylase
MRIRPPECGDPYAKESCGKEIVHIANRPPGDQTEFEAREIVDAGFLELVRYGIRRADDALIVDSLKVVDHVLKVEAPQGPCWLRYNHDGYGQREDGGPFISYGKGRAWPLLTGERAHYELAAGRDISSMIETYEKFASSGGTMPEQIWDEPDKNWLIFGGQAGSAMPLVWAHAEYLKLLRSLHDGQVFDQIEAVAERYANGREPLKMEVYKLRRPLNSIPAGYTLRVTAQNHFRILWTADDWKTQTNASGTTLGSAGTYADIPTTVGQAGRLSFTLFWTDENRWEGRNYDVVIEAAQ